MLMIKNTKNDFENLLYLKSNGMKFLANLEKINPNQKLTLEDFEALTDGDDEFVESIISLDSHNYGFGEFFEKIVIGKGVLHLRSLAIQLVSEDLFTFNDQVLLDNEDFRSFRKRSVRLANFLKSYSEELGETKDDAYLSGLFFNLPFACEQASVLLSIESGDCKDAGGMAERIADKLLEYGFSSFITTMVRDSYKEFDTVSFPLAQAISRVGNEAFLKIHKDGRNSLSDLYPDRALLDIIGIGRRRLFEIIKKQLSKN